MAFYVPTGAPGTLTPGASSTIRNEFSLIAEAFDLFPDLAGVPNKALVVNASGSGIVTTAGGLALGGDLTTFGAFSTSLLAGANVNLTLPVADGTLMTFGGGTMVGSLILAHDPSAPLEAATRQYVGNTVNNTVAGYLPLTGGNLSGSLGVGGQLGVTGASFLQGGASVTGALGVTGAATVGALSATSATISGTAAVGSTGITYTGVGAGHYHGFAWTGSAILAYVDGGNIGALATQAYVGGVAGGYLPLAGGVVTGALTVNGLLTANGNIGTQAVFYINSSGAQFTSDANYTYLIQDSGNWHWLYTRSSGVMQYRQGGTNTALFTIDGAGNIGALSNVAGASLSTTGNATVSGQVTTSYVQSNGGIWPDSTQNWRFYSDGSYRFQQYSPGWNWNWNISNGQLAYSIPGGAQYIYSVVDYVSYNWLAGQAGTGPYIVTSDERTKADIAEAPHGLVEILAIAPLTFRRWHQAEKRFHDRIELGFGAAQLQAVLPEAVVEMDAPDEWKAVAGDGGPVLGIQTDPILAAAVNAIKTLHARLTALETKGSA